MIIQFRYRELLWYVLLKSNLLDMFWCIYGTNTPSFLAARGLGQLPPHHTALAVHSHSHPLVIRGRRRRRRLRCVVSHGTDSSLESAVCVVRFPVVWFPSKKKVF